ADHVLGGDQAVCLLQGQGGRRRGTDLPEDRGEVLLNGDHAFSCSVSAGPASLVGRSPLLTSCAGVGGGGTIGRVLLTPPSDPDDKPAWRDRLRAARRALVEAQGAAGREAQAEALASVMLTWLRGYAAAHLEGRLRGTTVTAY